MKHGIETILQCPISKSPLSFLGRPDLAEVNIGIRAGRFYHLAGMKVTRELDAALFSSDGRYLYPIVDDILILLAGMAIVPGRSGETGPEHALPSETYSVMNFYDQVGWQKTDHGVYSDAERFEDLRPVSSEYIHRCHLRLGQYLPRTGQYLLDAASGPMQYPEYLTYSHGFAYTICADVSFVALKKAKARLGEKGIYVQCDICSLPLKDCSVDSFVSLHTIYHIPESKQVTAFHELHRVLRESGRGVIVYTWGNASPLMKLLMPWIPLTAASRKMLKAALPPFLFEILRRWAKRRNENKHGSNSTAEPKLYFHPHDYGWFRKAIASRYDYQVACWRSVNVPFLRAYIHERFFGRRLLSALFAIENLFPRFLGKYGQFPMIVCAKKEM